jgi:hypothetical protein
MMTTDKLMQYLPDRDYVASVLGLRSASSIGWMAGVGLFATGLVVGSAVAILLSPRSGADLRRDLRDRLDGVWQRMQAQPRANGEDQPHSSAS